MCRVVRFAMAISLLSFSASEGLAVGGDHPPGKIAAESHKQWPVGLTDLINSADRVAGHWVNQGDFFYYRGDVATLNTFLATYGTLPNTPVAVVLHTGRKPLTGPLGGEQKTAYDWQVEIMRRGWGAPLDPRQTAKEPGYVVTVHVWLGEAITLDRLDVPRHVEIRSAGDIERFINGHRERIR